MHDDVVACYIVNMEDMRAAAMVSTTNNGKGGLEVASLRIVQELQSD